MGNEVIVKPLLPQLGLKSLLVHNNDLGSHYRNNPWIPILPLLILSSKSDLFPQLLSAVVINEGTCWRHRPCCGVKNTSEISEYSKEYTFQML
jgi:hypothetical protein